MNKTNKVTVLHLDESLLDLLNNLVHGNLSASDKTWIENNISTYYLKKTDADVKYIKKSTYDQHVNTFNTNKSDIDAKIAKIEQILNKNVVRLDQPSSYAKHITSDMISIDFWNELFPFNKKDANGNYVSGSSSNNVVNVSDFQSLKNTVDNISNIASSNRTEISSIDTKYNNRINQLTNQLALKADKSEEIGVDRLTSDLQTAINNVKNARSKNDKITVEDLSAEVLTLVETGADRETIVSTIFTGEKGTVYFSKKTQKNDEIVNDIEAGFVFEDNVLVLTKQDEYETSTLSKAKTFASNNSIEYIADFTTGTLYSAAKDEAGDVIIENDEFKWNSPNGIKNNKPNEFLIGKMALTYPNNCVVICTNDVNEEIKDPLPPDVTGDGSMDGLVKIVDTHEFITTATLEDALKKLQEDSSSIWNMKNYLKTKTAESDYLKKADAEKTYQVKSIKDASGNLTGGHDYDVLMTKTALKEIANFLKSKYSDFKFSTTKISNYVGI